MWVGRLWQSTQSMRCFAALAICSLVSGESFDEVLGDAALHVFHVNVGDDLALLIGGHVGDLVADVHVPVNAFAAPVAGSPPPALISMRIWRGVFFSSLA